VDVLTLVFLPVIIGRGLRVIPDDVRVSLALIERRDFSGGIVRLSYRMAGARKV
jgi:hypothetical protein